MIDTNTSTFTDDTESKLTLLTQWIREANTIVWFTGAGISTESGLPDFRGPDGLWTRRDKGLPAKRSEKPWSEVEPNPAHRAIVELEKMGKCAFLISQNVDNLHIKSGYPFAKMAELHGNTTRVRCRPCGKTYPLDDFEDTSWKRRSKSAFPFPCPNCDGPLENSVIGFGQTMPEEDLETSFEWGGKADLVIVVGSSCKVTPAADIPIEAVQNGAKLVIMNIGETGLDDICHLRFSEEKVGQLLPWIVNRLSAHNEAVHQVPQS